MDDIKIDPSLDELTCDCCNRVMGYVNDFDLNGSYFVCFACVTKGAVRVRTPNKYGGVDVSYIVPGEAKDENI